MPRTWIRAVALLLPMAFLAASPVTAVADSKTLSRCGQGFLEEVDGYKVLHLKGSPYEMGYQQGALLKTDVNELVRFLLDVKAKELKVQVGGLNLLNPARAIGGIAATQKKYVPERFYEELRGLSDASGVSLQDAIVANFIPEMFHCSGFAIAGSATKDGSLYHGRILDYGCDWKLQDHAVLVVAEPDGKIPFLNVTYAGFLGSVTGMNAEKVSIGEMGGRGLGHWEGVPMAFLVRMALEEAHTLDEAVSVFRDHPRTCEYYYVIADGKTGRGVGMEASWDKFNVVKMGEANDRLPHAVKDAVLLSVGDRYEELARRVKAKHGQFDAETARHLMDRPVAMKSNLHSVLFETTTTRLWVANASRAGEPASNQPYHAFRLDDLLTHQPDPSVPVRQVPPRPAASAASR